MNWYVQALKKYADFSGRARRKEYWLFVLFNIVISCVLTIVDVMIGTYSQAVGIGVLAGIYALAVLIPGIAVSVRRLHDTDRSGWWLLIVLIPIIGPIVLIVFMCIDGTPGTNRFGPSPKEAPLVAPAPGELRVAARATGRGSREAGSAGNCESTQRGRHELSKLRRPTGGRGRNEADTQSQHNVSSRRGRGGLRPTRGC